MLRLFPAQSLEVAEEHVIGPLHQKLVVRFDIAQHAVLFRERTLGTPHLTLVKSLAGIACTLCKLFPLYL